MQDTLYNMIAKRKSFHLFRNLGEERLTPADLEAIRSFWEGLTPLCPGIRTAMAIVPGQEVTNRHGQEYCLTFYSEKKENYLQNIGYLGQQMDLFLVSRNIGTCWYGIGRAKEATLEGLDYVIMIALHKVSDPGKFRQDLQKAKRKDIGEIWEGESIPGVTDLARFAPSACNSQPWRVRRKGNTLEVYRYKKPTQIGLLSPENAKYFNPIDVGIYLCILQLCLNHRKIPHTLQLHPDSRSDAQWTLNATLRLEQEP